MSWPALAYVQRLRAHASGAALDRSEKMLLIQLAYYHNEEKGFAWVSTSRLAEEGITSMRQIQRLIKNCARQGTIGIQARSFDDGRSTANTYTFPQLDATCTSPQATHMSHPHKSGDDIQVAESDTHVVLSDTHVAQSDIQGGAIRKNSTERNISTESKEPLLAGASDATQTSPRASDEIYALYPRKVGPRKAKPAIVEALKRLVAGEHQQMPMTKRAAVDFLKNRVTAFARSPAAAELAFVAHPTTWFNQSRYLDDEKAWEIGRHGRGGRARGDAVGEARRRLERRTVGAAQ